MSDEKIMLLIVYDRAIDEEVTDSVQTSCGEYHTKWKDAAGVGRHGPHLGDHIWPGLNNVMMLVIDRENKQDCLDAVKQLQERFPAAGLRAFAVPVFEMV
jgi:hypothetical protein